MGIFGNAVSWVSRQVGLSGGSPGNLAPVTQAQLAGLFGPPRAPDATSDQIIHDIWVQPYRGPLDLDRYGRETPEMRDRYRSQYREVPVLRAAVRGKADDISCLEPTVLPADKDDALSNLAAEFVKWTVSMAPRGWRGVIDSIYTPASIDGFSLCEKKLEVVRWKGRTMWGLAHLRSLDTAFLRLQLDQYRNVLSVVNMVRGLEYYSPDQVVLYSHNPMYSNPFGQSDVRAATKACNIIDDVYKVWYTALKVYGLPYMHGKAKETHRKALAASLAALREGGYTVTGPEEEINILDLAGAALSSGFEQMVHTQREDVFFAVRGVAQPFMEGDGGADAHTDTSIQQGTSDAGEKGSALDIADALNRQLIPWLVRPNFGDIDMPRVKLGGTDWKQTETVVRIVKASQETGAEVSAEWFHDATNIPPPRDESDKLKPQGQGGMPGAVPGAVPGQPGAAPPQPQPAPEPAAFAAGVESEADRVARVARELIAEFGGAA